MLLMVVLVVVLWMTVYLLWSKLELWVSEYRETKAEISSVQVQNKDSIFGGESRYHHYHWRDGQWKNYPDSSVSKRSWMGRKRPSYCLHAVKTFSYPGIYGKLGDNSFW